MPLKRRYSTIWPYSSPQWMTAPVARAKRGPDPLTICTTSTAFSAVMVLAARWPAQGRPKAKVGGGCMLDELGKGTYTFEFAAFDVQAFRSEIEFVFWHGFRCFHHEFFILADLALHHRSNIRRRRGCGLGLWCGCRGRRRRSGALSEHERTRGKAEYR